MPSVTLIVLKVTEFLLFFFPHEGVLLFLWLENQPARWLKKKKKIKSAKKAVIKLGHHLKLTQSCEFVLVCFLFLLEDNFWEINS